MNCYYWSLATMMTVGTKGKTVFEIIFSVTAMLFTVCIFAYIINKIGTLIDEINKKK